LPSNSLDSTERWRISLARSRERRAAALRAARRRFRSRGGIVSLAAVLTVGALAAPLAAGHSSGGSDSAAQGSSGYVDRGDGGSQVSQVQQALGLPGDGVFGPETAAAVKRFQERNGLLVDGIVGPQTLAALGLASAATGAPEKQQESQPAPDPSASGRQSGSGGQSATGGGDQSSSGDGSGSSGSATSGVLGQIAQCESGGDPSAVSSDGQYRGKYQFTRETWNGLGGAGDPAQAPEAEQDRLAQQLLEQSGTDPWAGCL